MEQLESCPLCRNMDYRPVAMGPAGFRVVRCKSCHFMYTLPRPDEKALLEYYLGYDGSDASDVDTVRLEARLKARTPVYSDGLTRIARYKNGGRLLDVGCSFGSFLIAAREKGWDAAGVEPSKISAENARKLGFEVSCAGFQDSDLAPESFDVVTFWDVLEHLVSPREEIRQAMKVLKPAGLLVVRVPNGNFQLLKSKIPGGTFYIGSHLNHFTPGTLRNLLEEEGFKVDRIEVGAADHQRGAAYNLIRRWYVAVARASAHLIGPNAGNILVSFALKE